MKQHKWHKEPVAYMAIDEINGDYMLEKEKDNGIEWTPLYTRPTKSLTTEQVRSLFNQKIVEHGFHVSWSEFSKIVKDVEKAHGIGENK